METKVIQRKETGNLKRNFSKYDPSGTDPNRYASVTNHEEADEYLHGKKSIVPGLHVNVGKAERALMIAGGAYLLYRALSKKDERKVLEGITAGTMLFRGISGYCPAYDALSNSKLLKGGSVTISSAFTVNKHVAEVYHAWRHLESLPLFMEHLDSVRQVTDSVSEWKAKVPGGLGTISWNAEILDDRPNELLSWHSLAGAAIHNSGKVRFHDNGSSTDVELTISYRAPMGAAGEAAAKLLNPVFEKMITKDIEGFKSYMEAGNAPMP